MKLKRLTRPRRESWFRVLALTCPVILFAGGVSAEVPLDVQKTGHGFRLAMPEGTLHVDACTDAVIHVVYSPGEIAPASRVPVVIQDCSQAGARVAVSSGEVRLSTRSLQVVVSRSTGRVQFLDLQGQPVLEEPLQGARRLKPVHVSGMSTLEPQQLFLTRPDEAFYGLGQRQEGFLNWRDIPVRLQQVDAQIAIPMAVSNKGYGIFWNNPARTDFNPTDHEFRIDSKTKQVTFTSGPAGTYGFLAAGGTGREEISLKVNDQTIAQLKAYLVPYATSGKMALAANTQYMLTMQGGGDQASIFIKDPTESNLTGFRSEVGESIDYYFLYGPSPNKVISEYRSLTGEAPMFPKWAYGFLQCREHYSSQSQLLDAASGFRERKIPVDAIIQDWQYWGKYGWNAMRFDEQNYPEPQQMITQLHAENLKFLISVWSKFDPGTPIYNEMKSSSLLVPDTEWFDAFSPAARDLYWSHMRDGLFRKGVDGWWLDATEPEFDPLKGKKTALGGGELVRNAYPFYVTKAVFEGQKVAQPDQRVFILTRAAYAGQQRHAAASWSGDIGAGWDVLRKQIPAGLNFTASGIPYWTTDVGGFGRPKDQHESTAYHEILTRWFEYGVFCPLFRIHGNNSETEIWKYGAWVEANFRTYDDLRYRLLPYIYSTAWSVTHDGANLMRALPLDYRDDQAVAELDDEFMFGPSMLVNPITHPGVTTQNVYLPREPSWINFWTGQRATGGAKIAVAAPLETIPVFVKAGSIVTLGPREQFASEKSDPIELRIYTGADADTTLYEDNGRDNSYEHGAYAQTAIHWNESKKTLTVDARRGRFANMAESHTFQIVWVRPGHGTGVDPEPHPDVNVVFRGAPLKIVQPSEVAVRDAR